MNKENIIKKIEIQIGGTNVSVTPEEARNLLDALSELLNAEPKVKIIEIEKYRNNLIPNSPYWYYSSSSIDNKWKIDYSSSNNTVSLVV